ncbi:hypothetical protein QWY85_05375 [Neolewinella lacunae]|uniref:DUF3299 domain-containing protein n=1 Tax=Neolewinella lacunae TaxID=1517758 RepID=A0A923PNX2_9BACT|nr:hypothetical protein [Neolewinella lacunae]MBC6995131.1 hypothetical protein [Neolewinella lacunae]MDN3634081.1 hypothetical protein [Neolewinella lacunae]
MKSPVYFVALVLLATAAFIFGTDPKSETEEYCPPDIVNTKFPEPLVEKIILEDSVCIWDDAVADLRPDRPYRRGEELPAPSTNVSSDVLADQEPIAISWNLLTDIRYVLTYNKKMKMEVYAPVFPDTLKNLNGRLVSIRGYVIPFEEEQTSVALSAFPFAACFFCGKASPASVMTVTFDQPGKRYKIDARRNFSGKLRLNYDDPEQFYYVLEAAAEY